MAVAGTMTAVERMAASAAASGDAPEAFLPKAKLCLIDFLACAFEAADLPWSRQAEEIARPQPDGATIVGSARTYAPEDAAFANGVRGHGLVREDMHPGSIAHLGIVVWPALFALAQTKPVSGRAFLASAVLGYEAGGRLGRHLVTPEVARLFRPTGLVGPIAAAMAGAAALRLDQAVTANALSLAANTSGGLNQWPHHGADEMYFHPGFAARNALTALRLAEAGAWSSPAIVEGKAGLMAAFARKEMEGEVTLFPDGAAEIETVFNKPVPACNFAQSPCQAALAALQSSGRSAEEITAIRLETYDAAMNYPGCAATGPFGTPLQAKMSIAFGVAAALAGGEIAEANYSRLDDPAIKRLIDAMQVEISPELNDAFPKKQGARVTLTFRDGETAHEARDDIVFADEDLIRSRFRDAASQRLGADRAARLADSIEGLEAQSDAGEMVRLCGMEGGQ